VASTLRNVIARKMAPGVMDSSLAGALLGPAQLFEDFCAYLSDVAGFEVDKVSPAAITCYRYSWLCAYETKGFMLPFRILKHDERHPSF